MSATYWVFYILVLGGIVAFMRMRRSGQVPEKEGADLVKRGAMVIDVRTPSEFDSGHLSQAFNMPVDEIQSMLPDKVKDRNRVILVHCKTGMRSKKAKDALTRQGYTNVFDMGSYERAFKIVTGRNL
jgi:rhodanese-related sulfurtransferase